MPTDERRMTPEEFCDALEIIGESRANFARLLLALGETGTLASKTRTVQRWATGRQDVPALIPVVMQLLVLGQDHAGITTATVREWLHSADEN